MTYSYDPSKLDRKGVDRMRLELGDTTFNPAELTAALCDEEYEAIISSTKSWKRAKIKCLETILMKYSHQVNISVDGLSYSYASRIEIWKQLLADTKRTLSTGIPTANPNALAGGLGGDNYFHFDMHANPRKGEPNGHNGRR